MNKLSFIALTLFSINAAAQKELKISIDQEKGLAIFTQNASVDYHGYQGKSLLVQLVEEPEVKPELAKGTRPVRLNTVKLSDSLSYKTSNENNFVVRITGVYRHLHISVPNSLKLLTIEASSVLSRSNLTVNNVLAPFIVHAWMSSVKIAHVPGPFSINSSKGKVTLRDILWNKAAKWDLHPAMVQLVCPYMILSNMSGSDIDLSLPEGLKTNITVKAPNGTIYSNLGQLPLKANNNDLIVSVLTDFGNIYLRE